MKYYNTEISARDFTYPNPHSSFAPLRPACLAGWFVDGASYMAEVANAIEGATEEIFITDWWLSPEIYMKRPALDGDYWRLDKLLQRKAAQGIKIFVLLYKEVEMALGINSYYSKQRLVMQHENIKVMRHPDHARVGVLFWAHHEKLVIVDQTYAFVGGIDLCYGRWDDYRHRLVDMGSISAAVSVSSSTVSRKGAPAPPDPNVGVGALVRHSRNILVATSDDKMVTPIKHRTVLQPGDKLVMPETVEEIPENMKQNTPEMERRNVLGKIKENMKTKGRDLMARITLNEQEAGETSPKRDQPEQPKSLFFNDDEIQEGALGGITSPLPYKHPMLDQLDGQAKLWIGKDYVNFIMKDFINLELPYADLVDRNTAPRMPWHDVATVVVGAAARDAARHFIERWNAVKLEKARENNVSSFD
jgi:phospholipase D1/2